MRMFMTAAGLMGALFAVSAAAAEEPVTFELLEQRYDRALVDELKDFEGNPAQLMAGDQTSILEKVANDVFDDHWDVLKAESDRRLSALETRPESAFGAEPAYIVDLEGRSAMMKRMSPASRLYLKLWDPETFCDTFLAMALGKNLDPQAIALNAIVGRLTSKTNFKTRIDNAPALGADNGFWTVVITYDRDEYGNFLPLKVFVYERA